MSSPTDFVLVYVTTANSEDAKKIGRAIVERKLAACANILPQMDSIYSWKGKVCEDQEAVLILKTRRSLFKELMEKVRALHAYDCPCVLSLPIEDGNAPYLQWLGDQTTF